MPALAGRTKIKTGNVRIPTTTGIVVYGEESSKPYGWSTELAIEANVHMIASGSIRITTQQQYVPELSTKAKEILRKIYQFKSLAHNWDGMDAIPPNDRVITDAVNFLTAADEFDLPIYFTAPGPNGEIVLEYKIGNKTAEVYFEGDNNSEMILYNDKIQVYSGEVTLTKLIEHLRLIEAVNE